MTLRENQVLMSCAGTIGNVVLVNKWTEGLLGSQEIIRIESSKVPIGFLYAYLSSSYIKSYIQSMVYGAVIPRISPDALGKLPVLDFPAAQQAEIHELIMEASRLRVEANRSLKQQKDRIKSLLEEHYPVKEDNLWNITNSEEIFSGDSRIDAPFYASLGRRLYDKIEQKKHQKLSSLAEIYHPILFGKKQLKGTELKGNALYKSSSMMKLNPETNFWLSKKKEEKYRKLQVKQGWILVSRTGTVGNTIRIPKSLDGIFIDDHMIRIKPKDKYAGIIYVYLSTKYGYELISFQKYGTVQDVINSDYIGQIPIPDIFLEENLSTDVNIIVEKVFESFDRAKMLETQAIQLIEKEIATWQS